MFQYLRSAIFIVQMYIALPVIGFAYLPWALMDRRGAVAGAKGFARYVSWSAGWLVGLRCEVRGSPPSGQILVAAKHQSFLDILMIFAALPSGRFVMKKEILMTPVVGLYARRMGCVAVDRGKRGLAIEKMVSEVEDSRGTPGQLIIYSQGTRVAPGVKMPYKVGTSILYEQLGQPCAPVATNVGVFWPKHGLLRKPGVAVVEFLPVIEPGLPKREFMNRLEKVVEERSDALMAEAGFFGDSAS